MSHTEIFTESAKRYDNMYANTYEKDKLQFEKRQWKHIKLNNYKCMNTC